MRNLSHREAYKQAGYSVVNAKAADVSATQLAKLPKLLLRLQEMEQAVVISDKVTIQTVTQMLVDVYQDGRKYKQVGAAATAAMGIAKLHGLLVDRVEDVTRKPARHPDAPLEIEVEHWLTDHGLLPAPAPPNQGDNVSAPLGTEPIHQSPNPSPVDARPGRQDGIVNTLSEQGSAEPQGSGMSQSPRALEPRKPNENNDLAPPPGSDPEAGGHTFAEAPQKSGISDLGDD